jgi:hypothetical protein
LGSHALNLNLDREIDLCFNLLNIERFHNVHVRKQRLTISVEPDCAHLLQVQIFEDLLFESFDASFVVDEDAP